MINFRNARFYVWCTPKTEASRSSVMLVPTHETNCTVWYLCVSTSWIPMTFSYGPDIQLGKSYGCEYCFCSCRKRKLTETGLTSKALLKYFEIWLRNSSFFIFLTNDESSGVFHLGIWHHFVIEADVGLWRNKFWKFSCRNLGSPCCDEHFFILIWL